MCSDFSVVVSIDGKTAFIGKNVYEHSHSRICRENDLDVDNVFKFEIVLKEGVCSNVYSIDSYTLELDYSPPRSDRWLEMAEHRAWQAFRYYLERKQKLCSILNLPEGYWCEFSTDYTENQIDIKIYQETSFGYCLRANPEYLEIWGKEYSNFDPGLFDRADLCDSKAVFSYDHPEFHTLLKDIKDDLPLEHSIISAIPEFMKQDFSNGQTEFCYSEDSEFADIDAIAS